MWRCFCIAAALGAILARSHTALLHPIMHGEDSGQLFSRYLADGSFGGIFSFYMGYVSVLPNALGWGISWLPVTWQPYALAWTAATVSSFCFSCFTSARLAWLVPDIRWRGAIAALLAALPYGNFALDTCVAWSQWALLFAASLCALGRGNLATWELIFVALCIVSNPLSVVLLPAWAIWSRTERRCALLAAVTVIYQLVGVDHAAADAALDARLIVGTAGLLYDRVILESLIGLHGRMVLDADGPTSIAVIIACLPAVLLFAARKSLRRAEWWGLAAIAGLVVLLTMASVWARGDRLPRMWMWQQRYTYLPRMLFYISLWLPLLALGRGARRWTAWALLALGVLHAGALTAYSGDCYVTNAAWGDCMMRFIRAKAESGDGGELVGRHYRVVIPPAAQPSQR